MSGLMIDYNAMTKCLEETTEAVASAEDQASIAQQECNERTVENGTLHEELQEVKQQLSKKDSELEDCKIKLRWAQQAPRYSSRSFILHSYAENFIFISFVQRCKSCIAFNSYCRVRKEYCTRLQAR